VLAEAEASIEAMRQRPAEARQLAHRLRGLVGLYGLPRLARLAGMVEDRAAAGEMVPDQVAALADGLAGTRREIATLGSFAGSGPLRPA
jgi:hypothetical protein